MGVRGMIRIEWGWCVWVRVLTVESSWVALESTWAYNRKDSIFGYDTIYGQDYKKRRRRGEAKCVKSEMRPVSPVDLT